MIRLLGIYAEVVSALGPVQSEDNDWAIYYEQGANRLAK